jgi:hypothetical protein
VIDTRAACCPLITTFPYEELDAACSAAKSSWLVKPVLVTGS